MKIYHYASETGEYMLASEATESPMEPGKYLIPASATEIQPPEPGDHEAARFDAARGEWTLVSDYRGTKLYDAETGEKKEITALYEVPGDYPNHTEIAPPELAENQRAVWQGDAWGVEEIPPPVPESVSMRQARLALLGAGLLDAVESAIAGLPGDAGKAAKIEWEYATEIRRDNPLFAQLSAALGMSAAQLDDLFIAAAGL
jgi:hypothetical protein